MEISNSLIRILTKVCTILNHNDTDYCLIGGLAVSMVSTPRATEDIDLLIAADEESTNHIETLIRKTLTVIQSKEIVHFKNANIWRLVLKDDISGSSELFVVDFILADKEVFKNAIKNAIKVQLEKVEIPVASLEDLIKIKQLSGRDKDMLDIKALRDCLD